MKNYFLLGLFLMLTTLTFSREIQREGIVVNFEKSVSRFNLEMEKEDDPGKYFSVFSESDIRTTGLYIKIDADIFQPGSDIRFSSDLKIKDNVAAYHYSRKNIRFLEGFEIIPLGTSGKWGLRITIKMENIDDEAHFLGAGYIIDTYLGEKGVHHFFLPGRISIDKESKYEAANIPAYWVSCQSLWPNPPGLMYIMRGRGVSTPSKLVFANWKRLKEFSLWNYDILPDGDFNALPYSVNDSAAGIMYGPYHVEAGKSKTIAFLMHNVYLDLYDIDYTVATPTPIKENPDEVAKHIEEEVSKTPAAASPMPTFYSSIDQEFYDSLPENKEALAKLIKKDYTLLLKVMARLNDIDEGRIQPQKGEREILEKLVRQISARLNAYKRKGALNEQ